MGSNITSWYFWCNFLYFFVVVFLAFYIPGSFLFINISISKFHKAVLAIILGMVMWGLQGVLFGYLAVRFLSYVYILLFFVLWVIYSAKNRKKIHLFPNLRKIDWICVIILLVGVSIQLSGVWFMGVQVSNGLVQCCGHPPDNNLELAITNEIVHRFPPYEPGMFGVYIQNYHYWGHLVVGELVRVFKLPLIATEYQYMTVLISFGFGLTAIVLSQLLLFKKNFIRWFLFFLYFSGELTYLTLLILTRKFNLTIGSVENSAQFLMNYPRAIALIILMGSLSIFILWLQTKKKHFWYAFCYICGILIGFKVYVGFFALSGLGALFVYYFIRRCYSNLIPIILAFILAFVIYIPVNSGAGGLFFTGAWRSNNFAQIPAYNLGKFVVALDIFREHENVIKLLLYEMYFFILFVVSSFGVKILGLLQTKKSLNQIPVEFHIFLLVATAISFILGMFFIQKTGGANTFNFLVTITYIGSFYTAVAVSYIMEHQKRIIRIFITLGIITISIPRLLYMTELNIKQIISSSLVLSNQELAVSLFLKTKTPEDSIILVDPKLRLTDYVCPTLSYLADRPSYFSGILSELIDHATNYLGRQASVATILENTNESVVIQELNKSRVKYIVLSNTGHLAVNETSLTSEVFRNARFRILYVL